MPKKPETIAEKLRAAREEAGMSAEKFAHEIGVTASTILRWENEDAVPSPLALEKLKARFPELFGGAS